MLKRLLEWIAAARSRSHMQALVNERNYYLDTVNRIQARLRAIEREMQELIGELPARPANDWRVVTTFNPDGRRVGRAVRPAPTVVFSSGARDALPTDLGDRRFFALFPDDEAPS